MEPQQQQAPVSESVIVAYIKRPTDPNSILFANDSNRSEIEKLFKDPFAAKKKVDFDIAYELDDDECWEVPLSEAGRDAMKRQYVLSLHAAKELNINKREEEASNDIRTIYLVGETKVIFKHISRSNYLRGGKIISLAGKPNATDLQDVLAIGSEVHAVYNTATNRFYFTDFQAAKHVFGRLEVVYRSATQKEVDEWLDPSVFNVDDNFDTFSISTPNRKKMSYAAEELGINLENPELVARLSSYAGRHSPGGLFENGKFNIRSNADVTEALRIITGAYYQNEVTGDLMVAKSTAKAKRK